MSYLYQEIAESIRRRIAAGDLKPHALFGNHHELTLLLGRFPKAEVWNLPVPECLYTGSGEAQAERLFSLGFPFQMQGDRTSRLGLQFSPMAQRIAAD